MKDINQLKFKLLFLLLFSTTPFSQDDDEGVLEEDVLIELVVTGCYGHCPTYSLTIDGKGNIEYNGIQYVSKLGKKFKKISKKSVAYLLSNFVSMHFFQRKDTSDNCNTNVELTDDGDYITSGICITDSHDSTLIITVKFGEQYRKVRLEHYYSDDYIYLKDQIIQTIGVKKWVRRKI
jgi:hypothetical protein